MDFLKNIAGILSAVSMFLFGADPTNINWLIALLIFMGLDIIFGIHDSLAQKTFTRQALLTGLWKKIGMLSLIAISHLLDSLGIMDGVSVLQKAVTAYLIGYELLSIISHMTFAGVPIPTAFKSVIQNFSNANSVPLDNTDREDNAK